MYVDCTAFAPCLDLIPVVMEMIIRGPIVCTQLAAAALLNFTKYPAFHEQVSPVCYNLPPLLLYNGHEEKNIREDNEFHK